MSFIHQGSFRTLIRWKFLLAESIYLYNCSMKYKSVSFQKDNDALNFCSLLTLVSKTNVLNNDFGFTLGFLLIDLCEHRQQRFCRNQIKCLYSFKGNSTTNSSSLIFLTKLKLSRGKLVNTAFSFRKTALSSEKAKRNFAEDVLRFSPQVEEFAIGCRHADRGALNHTSHGALCCLNFLK